MSTLADLRIKIFADGADLKGMETLAANPVIKGLTTNPTLMRKAGLTDYEAFAKDVLQKIRDKPISFEVFADDFPEMRRQALKIGAWQKNVYVKVPISNTRGESALPMIRELSREGVKLNVTAVLTLEQVNGIAEALESSTPSVVSVFAGRIADTGVDPVPAMKESLRILKGQPNAELLWASCREVLNIFQANDCGAQIITVTHDVLQKAMTLCGMDLGELSLDTVKMFHRDATAAGFRV